MTTQEKRIKELEDQNAVLRHEIEALQDDAVGIDMIANKRIKDLEAEVARYRTLFYKMWRNRDKWVGYTAEARRWAQYWKREAARWKEAYDNDC